MANNGPYRKVYTRMASDEKFRRLTRPQPCGQALWWELLAGEQTDIIPGLFKIGEAAFADQLRWPLKGFRKAFQEVFQEGMVKADWEARLVWIPNALKYNPPANPNVVKSWAVAWEKLPDCELKDQAYGRMRQEIEGMGDAFLEAFDKTCRKPFAKAFEKAFGNPLPEPLPTPLANQETGDSKQESGVRNQELNQKEKGPSSQKKFAEDADEIDEPIALLQAAARRCTLAWRKTVIGRPIDKLEMCDDAFLDMLMRRVPEEIIIEKIGTKKRRLFLNKFLDKLEDELGMAPGTLFARPMLPESSAMPPAETETGFQNFKREFINRAPRMPKDHSFIDPWEGQFARMNPAATEEEMLFGLEHWLTDERRLNDRWSGAFPKEAMPHIKRAILTNRKNAEREAFRIAELIARDAAKARPQHVAQQPKPELPQAPPPWVAFGGDCRDCAEAICNALGASRFSLWFAGKTSMNLVDGALHIGAANEFLRGWLEKKFSAEIKLALASLDRRMNAVKFVIDKTLFDAAARDATEADERPSRPARGAGAHQRKTG